MIKNPQHLYFKMNFFYIFISNENYKDFNCNLYRKYITLNLIIGY